ncbi:MAG: flavin reductase family protein [Ruminococcaceae bacterium]|nr:flavin reductase family protein [Oscillospiraceae bacterium]
MFKKIDIRNLRKSPVKMISDDWALLTAGDENSFNTMTVSWGAVGELWSKDVAIVFVRPQRYTYGFMEKGEYFTLSFFDGGYKKELGFCGTKSGRDCDKIKETGFTPVTLDGGVAFEEADTVLVMKKIAYQDMKPDGFIDNEIIGNYAQNDFHRTYVGEIKAVYVKE